MWPGISKKIKDKRLRKIWPKFFFLNIFQCSFSTKKSGHVFTPNLSKMKLVNQPLCKANWRDNFKFRAWKLFQALRTEKVVITSTQTQISSECLDRVEVFCNKILYAICRNYQIWNISKLTPLFHLFTQETAISTLVPLALTLLTVTRKSNA